MSKLNVKVGDWVGFKCDIEQSGKIVKIKTRKGWNGGKRVFVLENDNGFDGGYIGGETRTEIDEEDCWI